MSKKHKKVCATLNYMEHFLILAFIVTGCISISAFTSLLGIAIRVMSSAVGWNIGAKAARMEKYKSIIKKKKVDKIVLLEVLISKALIDSIIRSW